MSNEERNLGRDEEPDGDVGDPLPDDGATARETAPEGETTRESADAGGAATVPDGPPGSPEGEGVKARTFAPLDQGDVRVALRRPDRAMELILDGESRLIRSLTAKSCGWETSLLLLVSGIVFALPMGALPAVGGIWKIAALFTGSVLICFPSLHVFTLYLGVEIAPSRSLALALLAAAVASAFSLGFFPIVWFIGATSAGENISRLGAAQLALVFLALSLVLGLAQLVRCLWPAEEAAPDSSGLRLLFAFWVVLLIFITVRMADVVGLV